MERDTKSVDRQRRNLTALICLLAIAKFIFPYLVQSSAYEPHRDEFLYLAEARRLAWGYYEVPPMLSFLSWFANLMGGSLFWIKFWPSLFGSLTYLLVARLVILLGGRQFALVLGFIPFVLGYYVHVHFMLQPNFLETFFWTLMAFGLILYFRAGKISGLYIAGVAVGLGLLSKYAIAFFIFGLLAGLVCTRERRIYRNKHFWFAALTGLLIFLPNLLWEWQRGLPFFEQMKELQKQQLQNVSRWEFLEDQLLYNLPAILIWPVGLYQLFFAVKYKNMRFVAIGLCVATGIIVLGHGKGYYGMPAYPILIAVGAVCVETWTKTQHIAFRYGIVLFAVLTGVFIDSLSLPFLQPKPLAGYYAQHPVFAKLNFLKWEDEENHPLTQDFADMLSWQEMTKKVARVYYSLPPDEQQKTIIDCDNYGEAAAVEYYGRQYHLKPVMCHAASFLFWTPTDFNKNDNFVYVTDYRNIVHDDFMKNFAYAAVVDSVTNPYAREYGSYILLLKNPTAAFRKEWKEDYEKLRKESAFVQAR
jgi:hypothetical protein